MTPNLDRLFAESVQCANSFVTTPVCSPSRAGLLCSRNGTEVGITDWINPRGGEYQRNEADLGLDPNLPTWVRCLRDAGYATGLVGKWHLGTQDRFHPSHFGYDYFAGFRAGGAPVENPVLEIGGTEKKLEGLTVDLLTENGLRFIRQAKQPFVLSLHHRSPHAPWLPGALEDTAPYEKELEIPNPDFPDLDVERVERMTSEYLSSVSGVDHSMAKVLALLEELSLADNTIVIFSSDNGYNIGHHGVVHKGNASWITKAASKTPGHHPTFSRSNMFDSSLRVPLAVRWPKHFQPGRVVRETVSNLDWFPTLLAMTGAVAPNGALIRGRNFLPLLRGEKVEWENSFYGQYSQHHYVENHLRMYRTPEWKLVRDFMNAGKDELYDLKNDPGETTNLLEKPEAQEMRARLNEVLLWKMKEINDPVSSA